MINVMHLNHVVHSLSRVPLLETPQTAARQASLSFMVSQSLFRFMSIELVMLSNQLIPSPPAFNLSQHQGLFQSAISLQLVAKILELQLQHQSFQ